MHISKVTAVSLAHNRRGNSCHRPGQPGLSGHTLVTLKPGFAHDIADLHAVFGIINFTRLFLGSTVLRMHAPGPHAFLMLKLDYGHPLAIVGKKPLCEMYPGIVWASSIMRATRTTYSSRTLGIRRDRKTVTIISSLLEAYVGAFGGRRPIPFLNSDHRFARSGSIPRWLRSPPCLYPRGRNDGRSRVRVHG